MAFHFNVSRDEFLRALNAQQNITNKKGTLAILANVLLSIHEDRIIITGTDLEVGLKQTISAEVFETGLLTLPCKKLFELVRESSASTLSFRELENNWVEIVADSSKYKLAGMVHDDFPEFPEFDEENLTSIQGNIFAELIDKTIFSISTDYENRFSLTGALLVKEKNEEQNILRLVSSDGHRLSIMNKDMDESVDELTLNPVTLIPRRGIQEIKKFCEENDEFFLGIEPKQAVFKSDESLLIIRLMDAAFPDYLGVLGLNSGINPIQIERLKFLESLKRINIFTEDVFHTIKIDITNNQLKLTSQNADFGSAKDTIEIS
ncbi:MAG: DNA polymerase III subunit beta, partial [Desulfobulbaceae bacterium]|nr:DNA polymerase III subunit beta [Desulfobulbaceae bacterium]